MQRRSAGVFGARGLRCLPFGGFNRPRPRWRGAGACVRIMRTRDDWGGERGTGTRRTVLRIIGKLTNRKEKPRGRRRTLGPGHYISPFNGGGGGGGTLKSTRVPRRTSRVVVESKIATALSPCVPGASTSFVRRERAFVFFFSPSNGHFTLECLSTILTRTTKHSDSALVIVGKTFFFPNAPYVSDAARLENRREDDGRVGVYEKNTQRNRQI